MTSTATPASATTTTGQFIQGIAPAAAISLVVGSMIGSGTFIVSADIGRQVALLVDPDTREFLAFGLLLLALGLPVCFLWHRRVHGGV